jgi:hypothetical protein
MDYQFMRVILGALLNLFKMSNEQMDHDSEVSRQFN